MPNRSTSPERTASATGPSRSRDPATTQPVSPRAASRRPARGVRRRRRPAGAPRPRSTMRAGDRVARLGRRADERGEPCRSRRAARRRPRLMIACGSSGAGREARVGGARKDACGAGRRGAPRPPRRAGRAARSRRGRSRGHGRRRRASRRVRPRGRATPPSPRRRSASRTASARRSISPSSITAAPAPVPAKITMPDGLGGARGERHRDVGHDVGLTGDARRLPGGAGGGDRAGPLGGSRAGDAEDATDDESRVQVAESPRSGRWSARRSAPGRCRRRSWDWHPGQRRNLR